MHDLIEVVSDALIEGVGDVVPERRRWLWIWLAVLAAVVIGVFVFL